MGTGLIEDALFWDVALEAAEIVSLAAGVDPWSVRPDHIVPLDDD